MAEAVQNRRRSNTGAASGNLVEGQFRQETRERKKEANRRVHVMKVTEYDVNKTKFEIKHAKGSSGKV